MISRFIGIILFSLLLSQAIAQWPVPNPSTFKPLLTVPCTNVKNQYNSSTCWSFAGISFIESELIRKGMQPPDLSEMYIARYSWLNKTSRHLATGGKSFLTPGGQFHDILKVIGEYGLVPEEIYNGRPKKEPLHHHSTLDTLLTRYLAKLTLEGKTKLGIKDLEYINTVLDQHLGSVPSSFMYRHKMYSPLQFTEYRLGLKAADYVEITSYTHKPMYQSFVLEDKYNWSGDRYYNVPLEDFMAIADSALYNGYTVCWDGDVTENGFQHENAVAALPDTVKDLTALRQLTYENGESKIDHMMHITGISTDSAGKKWYRVKNSWGDYSNAEGGWLYMNRAFFAIKTIALIVNKKALPQTIKRKLGF
jgi:bleomycin hydrolase